MPWLLRVGRNATGVDFVLSSYDVSGEFLRGEHIVKLLAKLEREVPAEIPERWTDEGLLSKLSRNLPHSLHENNRRKLNEIQKTCSEAPNRQYSVHFSYLFPNRFVFVSVTPGVFASQ